MKDALLGTATFAPGVHADDWRGAVRAAGVDLQNAGAVGPAYVDAMVQHIEVAGPYCVLVPGVAVPHARAGALVRRNGIAIVVLDEPVVFSHPHNDPVRVVIALATRTTGEHVRSLAALARMLERPGAIEGLVAASSREDAIAALGG